MAHRNSLQKWTCNLIRETRMTKRPQHPQSSHTRKFHQVFQMSQTNVTVYTDYCISDSTLLRKKRTSLSRYDKKVKNLLGVHTVNLYKVILLTGASLISFVLQMQHTPFFSPPSVLPYDDPTIPAWYEKLQW